MTIQKPLHEVNGSDRDRQRLLQDFMHVAPKADVSMSWISSLMKALTIAIWLLAARTSPPLRGLSQAQAEIALAARDIHNIECGIRNPVRAARERALKEQGYI